nr:hemolysin family protein [Calditrichia bacterium]
VRLLMPFLAHPERFLYTTLIGNNIFNVTFASLATIYLNEFLDQELTWITIVILSLMIGEIIPKTLFRSLADWLIRRLTYPMHFFYVLFLPLIRVISWISGILLKLFGHHSDELKPFFSEKDVEILLNESQAIVQKSDPLGGEVLSGILALKALKVRDAMIPRTEIVAIPESASLEELIVLFEEYEFTKVPVYRDNLDNIIGYVVLKDLLLEPATLKDMMRSISFVPDTKRCSDLLSEFRARNTNIAVVIDEYGGTAGLITTEDLVEELFGEIEDEYDDVETWIRPIAPHAFRVNARVEIEYLNQELGITIPAGEYDTLAGFILNSLGRIPRREETFTLNRLTFTIISASRFKLESILLQLPPAEEAE